MNIHHLCPTTSSLTPNMAIQHHVITMCVQHTKGSVYKNLLRRYETTWRSSKEYALIKYAPRKWLTNEWNTCFMNKVKSRFVPNLHPEQDNKVSGALAPPTKKKENCYRKWQYSVIPLYESQSWSPIPIVQKMVMWLLLSCAKLRWKLQLDRLKLTDNKR